MIPQNITRQHILQAIQEIDRDGVPANREARDYGLFYQGKFYPPKYSVALANKYANGRLLKAEEFGGGKETNDFLRSRGFTIENIPAGKRSEAQLENRNRAKSIHSNHHKERCKECKETVRLLLDKLYGRVETNYVFDVGALPADHKSSPFSPYLFRIHQLLQYHRGQRDFVRAARLPAVDFFVPNPGFIVEFDESQHFTVCRKIALMNYPEDLELGFSRGKWIDICDKTNASDNDPPFRDEQRAWYDTLRDFLPSIKSLLPTVRLCAKSFRWCSLNPNNPFDVEHFKSMLEGTLTTWNIEYRADPSPRLARIIFASEWDGNVEKSKALLNAVCDSWPKNIRTQFLITCGAFLTFEWPSSITQINNNKFPDRRIINQLTNLAENHCQQLIDDETRANLLTVTDFITIGIDTYKAKVSVVREKINEPHAEMVALLDLRTGEYHWTGKSYPTTGQEHGLVRFEDLTSHFVSTEHGKVMLLGCHDLNIFSPRGAKAVRKEWRIKIRDAFYHLAKNEAPDIVLHHPHTTDSSRIWTAAWNELSEALPSVKSYSGAGRYYNDEQPQRSSIGDVIRKTKRGKTVDIIVWPD